MIDYLFSEHDFNSALMASEKELFNRIDSMSSSEILGTSIEDQIAYLVQEFDVVVPKLEDDKISIDQSEADVDVSQDNSRVIYDRGLPTYIKGTKLAFYIPFVGDKDIFQFRPSTYSLNPPKGYVNENELILSYTTTDHESGKIKTEFDRTLTLINNSLNTLASQASIFNSTLPNKIRQRIQMRKEKLLADQGMAANLGFPIRRRDESPKTYVAPVVRRVPVVSRPQPKSDAPFKPEPALEMKEYEHILSIVSNMALVLERSPDSFKTMKEEDLRQHFLVQLNGQYKGQGTGETFNGEGKTDILLRIDGKNVFIAECKFWKGPETITETIEQLLGYMTWRDSKAAIILFNRNKNLTAVLEKIPEQIEAHKNFKRMLEYEDETGFRFVLGNNGDLNREITTTLLIFDVPK